jgi:succinate dehydrogenase / fumarate reductase cytochrome b subunit
MARYRGQAGYYAWALHRITGLGVLLFLAAHIVETFLLAFGPEVYDRALAMYKTPVFRVLEVGLVFAVLYHAVHGIRITIQDFRPALWRHARALAWAEALVLAVAFVPLAALLLLPLVRGEL